MKTKLLALAVVLSCCACVTVAPSQLEYSKARIIERMGDLDETPTWATGAQPMEQKDGNHPDASNLQILAQSKAVAEQCQPAY